MAPTNARSEDAFAKPMFRQSIQRRRCAIPADGFYEWRKLHEKIKVPYPIARKTDAPFFFAGIYEEATAIRPPTYLLFTCEPNELMVPLHNRMPVLLRDDAVAGWLTGGPIDANAFAAACSPYPSEEMKAYPVSTVVNSPKHDGPECVVPAAV